MANSGIKDTRFLLFQLDVPASHSSYLFQYFNPVLFTLNATMISTLLLSPDNHQLEQWSESSH